jgi:hypothetical protein
MLSTLMYHIGGLDKFLPLRIQAEAKLFPARQQEAKSFKTS